MNTDKRTTYLSAMKFGVFLFLFAITGVLQAQTKLIEKVTKTGDEIVIPYEKYELENGLTLIIHEDHSDPLVHVDVTYHVGSAREELYKSGFAHFFEHMMFQGSENVADEEHFKIVTESGGTLNGTTNRDRTNYFETVPANYLETALWLEADRMGYFLDAVTQKKFEVQRATVKNEKGQNYDNRPYGRFQELNAAALYPLGHPYSWLTIGKLEDLDRVDVDDLKRFFLRWYGPNNATLTVGGDVDPANVVKQVEKYFGNIPRGPEVEPLKLDPVKVDENRYVSYVDTNIRFPAVIFTWPTVPQNHPDEAALDALAEILGQGRSSYLYKKFVLTQKAIQAAAQHPTSELAGEFFMFVLPFPGQTLADFEQEVRKTMNEFEEAGVSDADLQKFIAGRESSTINRLASVSGKVSQLASYETFQGNPNQIQEDLKRYQEVTKEDIMRVYRKYVKDQPGVIVSVIPENGTPAQPDNYTIPTEGDNPFPTTDYSGLTYKRAAKDDFDRSKQPTPGPSPLVPVPDFWKTTMSNGIKVIGTNTNEIPTVALQLSINGGHKMDQFEPTKSGLALMTASMLNESTEKYTSEEIQEELRKLGSSINVFANDDRTILSINTLKKNLDATLDLANEILFHPRFDQADFDRLKKQQLEGIQANYKDPSAIANLVFQRLLYGDEHIYSIPSGGIEETVNNISLDDVKSFYSKYYAPEISELVVVGDISEKEILGKLDFLQSWKKKGVVVPELPEPKPGENTRLFLMDKKGAPQSEIRIGYLTDLTYDVTGDYFKSYLMNYPLGGAFNSRINLNLREDKGWTYGARSYFDVGDEPGPYVASAGVKASATDSAVYEFMKEIGDYRENGMTDEELEFMRNSVGQRDARSYETPGQKANFLYRVAHYDLDRTFVDEQTKIIRTISKEELNALAKKYLQDDQMYILVVGDGASNRQGLQRLGYEIVPIDEKGEVLSDTSIDTKK
ncbi:M16 family metallopeptidase [Fulvivirga sedimenti]|uniref:Insulinase family protein n=1 Tax=Fulvivirga sedimenti TaxID=2879465 RepID=A0A9X1HLA7_9BACT|nr:pitrilysin family protein [Fulvivirga sedimenti]MCA6074263.1 insulinase family protein [Fulvivirga sedimenti]